ncbi:MAG: F0F1 ATP synthase subunit delta [Gammaproteobacteria bacterium]|nr:MAG: F0F1 ATP synthase subunit delta [Gammaproteobacteria bacterium]
MSEKSTLARPYALAAFKQAQQEEQIRQWSEMLELLGKVATDSAVASLIADPRVPGEVVAGTLNEALHEQLSLTGRNFVRVLAENGRLSLLPEISAVFEVLRAEYERRTHVRVVSAFELSSAQERTIAEAMEKRLGQSVEITAEVDQTLIGGLIIRAGDVVIDRSVRGRLGQLATQIN